MIFEKSARKSFILLLSIIGVLFAAQITGLIMKYVFDHDTVFGLVPLFDFDRERNIPSLYSSLQLFFASILLTIIGASKNKTNREHYAQWIALSVIFLFLAVDESVSLHERLMEPIRNAFSLSGALYFSWVIPYGVATLVVAVLFSKFVFTLPHNTKRLFIASGAIYVTGALGFELLGGIYHPTNGASPVLYSLITTAEELLEMVGIALFIYALLAYISKEELSVQFNIVD